MENVSGYSIPPNYVSKHPAMCSSEISWWWNAHTLAVAVTSPAPFRLRTFGFLIWDSNYIFRVELKLNAFVQD